jgi:hypothetical protein
MAHEAEIQVGDRVVHLQVPAVFTVIARRGRMLELESERGLRMSVSDIAVRRVDGTPVTPKDS